MTSPLLVLAFFAQSPAVPEPSLPPAPPEIPATPAPPTPSPPVEAPAPPSPPTAHAPPGPLTVRAPGPSRFSEAYRPDPGEPSGLDAVVERWGVGLMRTDIVAAGSATVKAPAALDVIGVRNWLNNRFAVDAGVGFIRLAPDARTPTVWGVAPLLGVPIALTQWPHLTAYLKPQVGAYFVRFNENNNAFAVSASLLAGAELHLGWLHLPAVSLAAEMGGELALTGGKTDGQSFTGNYLRVVRPPSLEGLVRNIALRIYF